MNLPRKSIIEHGVKAVIVATARSLSHLPEMSRSAKRAIVVAIDAALLVVSVWLAYSLRTAEWMYMSPAILQMVGITAVLAFPLFYMLGVYRVIFRYAGVGMLFVLARAFVFYTFMTVAIFGFIGLDGIPRTMGLLQPIIFFGLICSSRITIRYVMTDIIGRREFDGEVRTILIYGAGARGQALLRSLRDDSGCSFAGFVDDDRALSGQTIDASSVWHSDDLEEIIKHFGVTDVVLAKDTQSRSERRQIIKRLDAFQVTVRYLPLATDILSGRVSVSDLRPIAIEDLLGREPVAPKPHLLSYAIAGKTVMVTGAGGSIGSELVRQIRQYGASRLILLENSELALYTIDRELSESEESFPECEVVPILGSVRDASHVDEVFRRYAIDTVFHAAAYKHVPLIEANPMQGIRNNILGTLEVARASLETGVSNFILISTDKAVRPTNIMGATKRAAEQVVQALAQRSDGTVFSMVRFGNVLGSSGSVVPLFKQQIKDGGPITITHREVTRYFMTIPEAANLVIQSSGMAKGGEVFVLDMGEPIKIFDLAKNMIRLSGLTLRDVERPEGDIEILETGLRPGEKLYEELLIGDAPTKTQHERVMMAHEKFVPWEQLSRELEGLSQASDIDDAIVILKRLVPELAHMRDNTQVQQGAGEPSRGVPPLGEPLQETQ